MHLPKPLAQMFSWIEENGLFIDTKNGRVRYLHSGASKQSPPGTTAIAFTGEGNVNLKYWFGKDSPQISSRLSVFAHTGADGSMAAFWLDDDGSQKIVHMGSGSGSTLVCILAEDAVDFLRLLAIGYDEICWGGFSEPPDAHSLVAGEVNSAFADWVLTTFDVTMPARGSEIVKHPSQMGDIESPDRFCQWVQRQTQ